MYQISLGISFLFGLMIIYVALWLGAEPYSVSVVAIIIQIVMLVFRLYFSHKYVGYSYRQFVTDVLVPIIFVTVLSIIPSFLLKELSSTIWQVILAISIEVISIGLLILFVGMSSSERCYVIRTIKQKI